MCHLHNGTMHVLGTSGVDLIALSSKSSMNKLAITGDKGEPIASPSVCSRSSSPKCIPKTQLNEFH